MKYSPFILLLFFVLSCKKDNTSDSSGSPNILLIIADDMGKDATAGFSEGSIKPNTPNIDGIAENGLLFNNLWVYPTCSPTRSSIITGKYGYRTGVKWATDELDSSERILQKVIKEESSEDYATAIVGKWHLSGNDGSVNPETFGMDYYAGLIRGSAQSYYQWQLSESGNTNIETDYITEVFTDLSIDWVNNQSKPWFLWLAYNAPHTPFHVPPSEMHSQGDLPEYVDGVDEMPYYMAAIEAMDFQIGRLLSSIPQEELDNTIIFFLGDNGSPNQVAQSPYAFIKAKGSLYQGGVNVPFYVSGKGVSRVGEDDNLLTSTDIFATIAELTGAGNTETHDGKSFRSLLTNSSLSHRTFQYSEKDDGDNDLWAISNGTYKLIINANGNEEMYHLDIDPYENDDLLEGTLSAEAANAKIELETELANIRN